MYKVWHTVCPSLATHAVVQYFADLCGWSTANGIMLEMTMGEVCCSDAWVAKRNTVFFEVVSVVTSPRTAGCSVV